MRRALIVGAGHNGLICAFYLQRAGFDVTVLERASRPGGACRALHQACGCRLYPGASHFGMLHPEIANDLGQAGINLATARPDVQMVLCGGPGESIVMSDSVDETAISIARYSSNDADQYRLFTSEMKAAAEVLAVHRADPQFTLHKFAKALEKLGPNFASNFALGSLASTLSFYFEHPLVQGALASSMILFNGSPNEVGTAFALPYYYQMQVAGKPGWEMLVGGMEHLTNEIASFLSDNGCTIVTSAEVSSMEMENGVVTGVTTSDGKFYGADLIAAACDPLVTSNLLRAGGHTSGAWRDLRSLWARESFKGMCGKAMFLLDRVPDLRNSEIQAYVDASRTMISNLTSLQMMENAHQDAQLNGFSDIPYVEVLFPSIIDSTQACEDHVTMSVYFMYCVHRDEGQSSVHTEVERAVLGQLDALFLKFPDRIQFQDIWTSNHLSNEFGMSLGNVDHGSLTLDYSLGERGLPGYVPPTTDIKNLFLSSSGAMPGGLVSGVPGYIAAKAMVS
ncbi:phytoene desaturase family protein [Parasphingorhabdus sp.]|uniref:phytoene desaturase family protein n=1 Tax=Parasphingorhabdus sp. TaxID=2709688 RepID=UPI003593B2AF